MFRVAVICLLAVAALANSDTCPKSRDRRHGETCSCTDVCLGNSHCQLDVNGGYSCQCLPCSTYNTTRDECVLNCKETCEDKLIADIYFLADSSNSIAAPGWQKELIFITKVSEAFHIGPNDVQISFGIFSTNFKHIFDLNEYTDQDSLARVVLSTSQLKSNTHTFDALDAVNNNGYLTSAAHGGGRDVPKVLIVITDGQSQDVTRTIAAANALRNQNIQILSVGVGIQNQDELRGIAGNSKNVFNVRSFSVLDTIRSAITQRVCEVSDNTPAPDPVTTPEPEPTTTDPADWPTALPPTTEEPSTPETTTPERPTTPEATTTVSDTVCTDTLIADIYFLADSSNSIAAPGWLKELIFITKVSEAFHLGPDDVQVAFGIFSTNFKHIFDLNEYTNQDDLARVVSSTSQIKSNTYTFDALKAVNDNGFLTSSAHGARNVPKILIVITDGQSHNVSRTIAESEKLRNQGIKILSVGVGIQNQEELRGISGDPKNVFNVRTFSVLDTIRQEITQRVCEVIDPTPSPEPETTTPEPTTTTPEPTTTTPEPTTTTPEPTTTTPEPPTTPEPTTTTPEPTTTTPEPTTTTPEPTTPVRDACREDRPCQHDCISFTDGSYLCSCQDGYVVSPSDPTKCNDINECTKKPCQQVCTNNEGSFTCSCNPGFAVSQIDPTKCQEPTCIDKLSADIYFLGDSSNSIAAPGWQKELRFIVNVTQVFQLGPDDVQVAFGIFGTNFKHIFNLNAYTDQSAFAHAVLSTAQLKSNTYTYDALNAINTNEYLYADSFGGSRDVPKIVIVVTDGQSQSVSKTIEAANNLRKKGITLFSVGVGLTNPVELQGIAGSSKNVFNVRTFNVLDTIRGEITQRICDVPELPEVTPCADSGKLDLVFVVDTLSKFGTVNFNRNLVFLSSIIQSFAVHQNDVTFAVVVSDINPVVMFDLTSSLEVVYEKLTSDPGLNVSAHTYRGLLDAADLFTPSRGGREDATKTIILLSDGKSSDPLSTIVNAERVKTRGINVITLAILPEVDVGELSTIASTPENNILARNYASMLSSANKVALAACSGSK